MGSFAKSTPTLGLEVIFNYMPLDLMAREWAHNTANRIQGRNKQQWDYIGQGRKRGHLHYYKTETLDSTILTYQWEGLPTCNITDGKPFTPPAGDYILAYTDGSKIEDCLLYTSPSPRDRG